MPEPNVTLNEESLKTDLRELVRRTVEDTLNGLLEEEAGDLVGAERYERTAEREAYRAGHCDRSLTTSSGEVTIHMPKLKGMRFTTAIIERYRRRETSVEEAMIEMYLAGVSTRRIEDVSEILWGSSVSAATESAPFPLTHGVPFRHDAVNGERGHGMGHPSPKYSAEFKQQAVRPYGGRGGTYAETARELGVDAGSISDWVKRADTAQASPEDNPFKVAEENRRLRREVERLRRENEVLLKASAFFASRQL